MRLRYLLLIAALSAVIAGLQFIALSEFLYWRFWWFDMVMHFLGGMLIAGIALFSAIFVLKTKQLFLVWLLGLVSIGIGWEVFELLTGMYRAENYVLDTSIDLLMDTFGALAVYSVVTYERKN